ncbi:ribosome bioproteinsis protein ytm1 [Xanthoria calcicola]
MPSHPSPTQLCTAILDSVQHGLYPDSEDIISAPFPPSALSDALKLFDNAREQVKARVRSFSQDSAQDIDGWISQAKQLRNDIETVQSSARDISFKAQKSRDLQRDVHDASSKLHLLEEELAFNQAVAAMIEDACHVRRAIGQIQHLSSQGDLLEAIEIMVETEKNLELADKSHRIKAFGVLAIVTKDLRQEIVEALNRRWHHSIRIDAQTCTVSLPQNLQPISAIASAMENLGLLLEHIVDLSRQLELAILLPRLQLQNDAHEHTLVVDGNTLKLSESASTSNMPRLIDDLSTFIAFLIANLPPSIVDPLSKVLMPLLVERLISLRLAAAIPENLSALRGFDSTRNEIQRFSEAISSYGWPAQGQLNAWIDRIPRLWVQQRQISSLDNVRLLLRRGYGEIKTVERVETQVVSQQDRLFTANAQPNNWDAGWSDQDGSSSPEREHNLQNTAGDQEEEDVSAWGLHDEADEETNSKNQASFAGTDDAHDAWGWGDDQNIAEGSLGPQGDRRKPSRQGTNGHDGHSNGQQEVTLREFYNITTLPVGILDLINNVVSDMDDISKKNLSCFPPDSAVPGLCAVPNLLLVMYRASASNFYSINNNGNMFLYNDCLWLVDQLQEIVQRRSPKQGRLRLHDDIVALGAFGKRSYGREMESQRTIIKDLLDGAQGFVNCTEPPFSQECDLAVRTMVDRLRDTHRQWKGVLSYSALLQSLGSLLSTVIDKIIIDVEDMSDISEPESQRLTAYCRQIIAVEDLFLPQQPADSTSSPEDAVPLTAVYVPGWFRFQYLSEILDSSLVDIKYLWTDGGLKLEYDMEEVVDMIEALFADSEHRRRAIGDIRRSSGR